MLVQPAVAVSANGSIAVASTVGFVGIPGWNIAPIIVSHDGGSTWLAPDAYTPPLDEGGEGGIVIPLGLASTPSGNHLWAVGQSVQTSTVWLSNDFGRTWDARINNIDINTIYFQVATSADGDVVAVVQTVVDVAFSNSTPAILVSKDSGATWTRAVPGGDVPCKYNDVAMSADGQTVLVACGSVFGGLVEKPGFLYLSRDSGASWVAVAFNATWSEVTMTADASHFAAAVYDDGTSGMGGVYLSTDGVTWAPSPATALPTASSWAAISYARDGSLLAAAESFGYVWLSHDHGASWAHAVLLAKGVLG